MLIPSNIFFMKFINWERKGNFKLWIECVTATQWSM